MIWLSASLYSKCTVFTVNLCFLQALAMYKKVLSFKASIWRSRDSPVLNKNNASVPLLLLD